MVAARLSRTIGVGAGEAKAVIMKEARDASTKKHMLIALECSLLV